MCGVKRGLMCRDVEKEEKIVQAAQLQLQDGAAAAAPAFIKFHFLNQTFRNHLTLI